MAITPVQSSSDAATQAVQQPKKHTPTHQAQQTQTASASTETATARQTQRPAPAQAPETPKPVVNTQGQTTGKIVNATA
jgi:hypothetical protein